MFDADLRKLIFGKEEIQILPQTAILLKHFLEAPDYILKDEEIKKILESGEKEAWDSSGFVQFVEFSGEK